MGRVLIGRVLLIAGLATLFSGCKDKRVVPTSRPGAGAALNTGPTVLLEGTLEPRAKAVSGKVRIEQTGDTFELVVNPINVPDIGPVHVYLVGLPKVRTTADLDSVDAKYDFGPLEQSGSNEYVREQRITLPSKPADDLRSVAFVNPRFGVVLGASSLREPKSRKSVP